MTTDMTGVTFNVTCMNVHVFNVIPGGAMETLCLERDSDFISAMVLNSDECPRCIEELRARIRQDREMMSELGCLWADNDGVCRDESCSCKRPMKQIPDSVYDAELIDITATLV